MKTNISQSTLSSLSVHSPAEVRTRVRVPIRGGVAEMVTFRGLVDGQEHLALAFGDWATQGAPLVRMHSECLTGDVFGSEKCDCGDQLDEAIGRMQRESGVLLYLRQEGRGIGLYNKLDAYELQSQGADTYLANQILGFDDDLRSYEAAAQMLLALGLGRVRLLSNNPDKRGQLERFGIDIAELELTGLFEKEANRRYLAVKASHTGHLLMGRPEAQNPMPARNPIRFSR